MRGIAHRVPEEHERRGEIGGLGFQNVLFLGFLEGVHILVGCLEENLDVVGIMALRGLCRGVAAAYRHIVGLAAQLVEVVEVLCDLVGKFLRLSGIAAGQQTVELIPAEPGADGVRRSGAQKRLPDGFQGKVSGPKRSLIVFSSSRSKTST